MIVRIPMTGEIINEDEFSGNPDNPVRPVDLRKLFSENLSVPLSWQVVKYDLGAEMVTLRVFTEKSSTIKKKNGNILESRIETNKEFSERLTETEKVLMELKKYSFDELYIMSNENKLKRGPGPKSNKVWRGSGNED